MRDFMEIVKAMADENRIRILYCLKDRELCVCQVIEFLGLAPSTTSKHLSILHQARLLDSQKKGRWVYYRTAGPDASPVVQQALAWVFGALEQDKQIQADRQTLEAVLRMEPEELCKIQAER